MTLTEVLRDEAETTYAITDGLMRRVTDDDLSWRPGEGWMTVGQLLMHCACFGCGQAVQGFVSGDWGPGMEEATPQDHLPPPTALPSVASVQRALELLAEDRQLALASVAAAGEENLLGRCVAAPWGGPALPLFQQLLHMIAHLTEHKGQLFYYLKLLGRDVKTADLWGE